MSPSLLSEPQIWSFTLQKSDTVLDIKDWNESAFTLTHQCFSIHCAAHGAEELLVRLLLFTCVRIQQMFDQWIGQYIFWCSHILKQNFSSCCSHFNLIRPRWHLTTYQQYFTTARLWTGSSQMEVSTELSVTEPHQQTATEIPRDWKSHKKA